MTDQDHIRPTKERVRHADHMADDGKPTQKEPYVRAQRLGTAWDRYSRDRDKDGKLLDDEAMILTRRQIAAGTAYIDAHEGATWGYPSGAGLEPRVSSSFKGPPADCVDAGIAIQKMEDRIRPRYLISLLQAVCLEGHSAETWAGATGRHPKSGVELFRATLDMISAE